MVSGLNSSVDQYIAGACACCFWIPALPRRSRRGARRQVALLRALLRERSDPALSLLAYRCARARAARPPLKLLTQKCPRKHPRRHSLACIGNRQAGPYLQMPHRGADASDARLSPPLWQVPGAGPASHRPQDPQVLLPCLTRPLRRSRPPEPSPAPILPPRAAAAPSIKMKSMEHPLGCARPRRSEERRVGKECRL